MKHKAQIKVSLWDVDDCHKQYERLEQFLQAQAGELQDPSWGNQEISITEWNIVGHDEGYKLIIEVEVETA